MINLYFIIDIFKNITYQIELTMVKIEKFTHFLFIHDRHMTYLYPRSCKFKNHKRIEDLSTGELVC